MGIEDWYAQNSDPLQDSALGQTPTLGEPQQVPDAEFEDFQAFATGQAQEHQLSAAMRQAQGVNPDQQAEIFQLQGKTGLPAPLIERNLELVRQQSQLKDFDARAFRKDFPKLSGILADRDNARLAQDDLDALKVLERTLTREKFEEMDPLEWLMSAPLAAWEQGQAGEDRNSLGFRQLMGDDSPELEARLQGIESELGQDFGGGSLPGDMLTGTAEFLPQTLSALAEGFWGGMAAGTGAATTAAVAGQLGPQAAVPEEIVTVPGAFAAFFAAGSRTGAAQYAFRQEAGAAFREFSGLTDAEGEALSPGAARIAAVVAGGVSSGLELFGLETLVKSFPGGKDALAGVTRESVKKALQQPTVRQTLTDMAARFGGVWSIETMTEVMQEGVMILGGELAKGIDGGSFEGVSAEEVEQRLTDTFVQAAKGMALISAPGPISQAVVDYGRVKTAERNQQIMTALGEGSTASKTRERLPEKFREIVAKLREGGATDNVHIPVAEWTKLFQGAGVDPAEVANQVTGSYRSYQEAQASGADLVIPLEAYAQHLAASEYHAPLMEHSRFNPDQMTPSEARAWQANEGADLRAMVEALQPDDASQGVYDDVFGQLQAAGRDTPTAEREATLMQAVFRSLGERTGADPLELYRRYNISIGRPVPEVLKTPGGDFDAGIDPILDRLRAGDIPSQSDAFGRSLIEFLRDRGINDQGGELAARDVDTDIPAFTRRLIREDGIGLDEAAGLAVEYGYLPGKTSNDVMPDDLLALIEQELSGEPVFPVEGGDRALQESRSALLELAEYLDQIGVDLDQMDNAAIRAMLEGGQPAEREAGEATTLDSTQYLQPGTEAFNNWFGDSKVVDENGEPLVVKHGSRSEFTEFNSAKGGIYFSTDGAATTAIFTEEGRGDVGEYYLSLQNPFDARWKNMSEAQKEELRQVITSVVDEDDVEGAAAKLEVSLEDADPFEVFTDGEFFWGYGRDLQNRVLEALRGRGYDGVIFPDALVMGDEHISYVAFRPEQIKSATDNRGTFDPNDPNILNQQSVDNNATPADTSGIDVEESFDYEEFNRLLAKAQAASGQSRNQDPGRTVAGGPAARGWRQATSLSGADGQPKTLYRGASRTLSPDDFAPEALGFATDNPSAVLGVWFTTQENDAARYGDPAPYQLDIRNPAIFETDDVPAFDTPAQALAFRERLQAEGYDGIVFDYTEQQGPIHAVAFAPDQVIEPETSLDQSAFHGTPHQFDRFSLEAMGTGEGAQAFGWGLYFAGNRGIAEYYRDALSTEIEVNGNFGAPKSEVKEKAAELFQAEASNPGWLKQLADDESYLGRIAQAMIDGKIKRQEGNLFEVEIPDDADLLDYDAPLHQQPEAVLRNLNDNEQKINEALGGLRLEDFTDPQDPTPASDFYRQLSAALSGDQAASLFLNGIGIPGLRYLDATSRDEGDGSRNYVIWDEDVVTVQAVNDERVQAEEMQLEQTRRQKGPRGRITFPQSRAFFNIELLENADLSTFLHESGHLYLEILRDLAQGEDAPAQLRDDFQTILDWFGVASAEQIGVEQHELWARGFEAYVMEGKAPSVALRSVFARFKAWLLAIYRTVDSLNVTLTDEVRQVMDRLVATDQEIGEAQEEAGYAPLFEDGSLMTPEEFAAYQDKAMRARMASEDEVTAQVMREYQRERADWWREARASVREEVAAEVNQRPEYVTASVMGRGKLPDGSPLPEGFEPFKLNKQALIDAGFGSSLKRLPRPYVYTREGGVSPDEAAAVFGYNSGAQMLEAMINARPRAELIKAETQQRLFERYGNLMEDGGLSEAAASAVHNERRAEVLELELRKLGALSNRRTPPARILKDAAARIISEKTVRQVQPHLYLRAEARASREAFAALAKQDYAGAGQAKQKQLFNHFLYREARAAQADVDSTVKLMTQYTQKKPRARLGKAGGDYLAQVDSLLERYEFRRSTSGRQIDRRRSLQEWVAEQEQDGLSVSIPEAVLNDARRVSYKEIPVEELRGIRDTVKQIEHLARLKNKLLAAQDQRSFEETVDNIVATIDQHHGRRDLSPEYLKTTGQRVKQWGENAHAWLLKPEFIFRWLDGDAENGAVWSALFKPIAAAEDRQAVMNEQASLALAELFAPYTRAERAAWRTKAIRIQGLPKPMTKQAILAAALNTGNAYNREVLMESHGWNEAQLGAILGQLDRRDWDLVQGLWDHIDSYWPEASRLEKDLTGVAPEKVEALPFRNEHGSFRGGYYPVAYDPEFSITTLRREEKKGDSLFENSYTKPQTKTGHLKARTGPGGQVLRLDLAVISEHVANVIHDISHRRAIIDVNRLLENKQVQTAIRETAGPKVYEQLRPWLQAIANEQLQPESPIERLLGRARVGATVVNMGLKITTAVVQPLGYLNSVRLLGPKYALQGLRAFMGSEYSPSSYQPWANMKRATEFAQARSVMMQNRQKTFDRDVKDSLNRLTNDTWLSEAQRSFFILTGLMDMAVSVPTWLGAYKKAMEGSVGEIEAGDEARAIDFADAMVRQSQSAGGAKDLARIQRGGPVQRSFVMFYSYFSVLYNQGTRELGNYKAGRQGLPGLAAASFFLWFAPAILGELIAARGPEEDEDWAKWAAKQQILYATGTVPMLRDMVNSSLTPYGFSPSPAWDAFEYTARATSIPYKIATDEEVTRADIKAAWLATSYWAHLPGRQSWITGEYLYDFATGADQPENPGEFVRDLFFSRPASER